MPGSLLAAELRPGGAALAQPVGERPGGVTGRGVHHHPGGLVDDGQRVVLVHDRKRHRRAVDRVSAASDAGGGMVTATSSAGRTRWPDLAGRSLTRT